MIEFDCETTSLQPWSQKGKAFLWSFYDPEVGEAEVLWPDKDNERIQWWLNKGATEGLRAWNTGFDRAFAEISGYHLPSDECFFDGMIIAHTLNERRSIALKAVGTELFGEEAAGLQKELHKWLNEERRRRKKHAKETNTEYEPPNFSDVPEEIIVPYSAEDVILTRKVCAQYEPLLAQTPELQSVVDFEHKVMPAVYDMVRRGLPAEQSAYNKLEIEVVENLEILEDRVLALAAEGLGKDAEFNPKSTPQVIEALKARGADLSHMSKKNNKLSADRDNLEAVDDELAEAILEFRSEYKVLSTYVRPMVNRHYDTKLDSYVEPFVAPDGRIHANYRQIGARTGRFSCSGPNMQNQPRDDLRLRYNVRAEEGHKLVTCDLSGIEMRLFAAYAGEGRMLRAVRERRKVHAMTAAMLGIKDRRRAGGAIESAEQRGKTFNYSVLFGGGLRTIRRQQRVDQAGARLMQKRYYDAYPEIRTLQNIIEWKLKDQGYIKDLWNRRYRCDNPDREAYKFANYLVQGSAAQILKEAMIELYADGVPVVAVVHDEIIAHPLEADAEEVMHLINKRLTAAAQPGGKLWSDKLGGPIIPLDAEGAIVDRWSQAKDSNFVPKWSLAEAT